MTTLVSHNSYWFQGAPSLWGEERTHPHPLILTALTRFYRQLAPDILCLQEVPSEEEASRLAEGLGMHSAFAPGGRRPDYGGALLWQGFDAEVENLTGYGDTAAFERMCLVLQGTVADGLTVVNVHLSSNRYAPGREGDPVRLAELQALFAACPHPDVIAGDFNATPGGLVYQDMVARGFVECGSLACVPARADERRVDYIWIREARRLQVEPTDFQPAGFLLDKNSQTRLSDHPPIIAQLFNPNTA
jgi:endonuclease/exonuclease/phosphatase family metal-dependent hydrolase